MFNLFTDKIEEVLEKHNVVVSNFETLKNDLMKIFLDSQLNINQKKVNIPKSFKDLMKEKGFVEKDITTIFKTFVEWIQSSTDGAKWFCSMLGITREVLTSDFAVEYLKKNGQKVKLKPKNIVIYHRKQ